MAFVLERKIVAPDVRWVLIRTSDDRATLEARIRTWLYEHPFMGDSDIRIRQEDRA